MKPLRILGVFALMVAGLLLLSASSASATVLCTDSSCTLSYASGTKVSYTLKSGTTSRLSDTSSNLLATCTGSTMSGKTSSESGTSISSNLESLTWSSCSQTTTTVKNGSLSIAWTSGTNGSVSGSGSEVTTTLFGVSCTYGPGTSTTLGTLTGGATPVLSISAVLKKTAGSFLCPGNATWSAEYVITEPHALYVGNTGGGGGGEGGGATSTTLTTSLSGESKSGEEITVNEGSKVKDTATLSGTNASKATGTVKYKVYADKECKELVTSAGEVTVTSGSVPASEEKTLEAGRVYYWQAEYGGDTNNLSSKSTCGKEVLTVKAATSLATSLSGESKSGEEITILEGSKVKDTATLSGTKSTTATGKVKFKVYKDKECKELAAEAGEGSLSEGKASSEEKTLEAGAVYYWQAEYPGDSVHQSSTSTCGKEILTVKGKTALTTTLRGEPPNEEPVEGEQISLPQGVFAADTATLEGTKSSTATGKVKFKVYKDKECKELVSEDGEASVEEGSVGRSEEIKLEEEGIYYWQATYEGDSLHQASTSSCGDEVLTVKAAIIVSTLLTAGEQTGEAIELEEEAVATDAATLEGAKASVATGKVKYSVYADPNCEEFVAGAGEMTVSEGKVSASEPLLLEPGIYFWQAHYTGDTTNSPATSECGSAIQQVEPRKVSLRRESDTGVKLAVTSKIKAFNGNLEFQTGGGLWIKCENNLFRGEVLANGSGAAGVKLTSWEFRNSSAEGRCDTTETVGGKAVYAVITSVTTGRLWFTAWQLPLLEAEFNPFDIKVEKYVGDNKLLTCRFGRDEAPASFTFKQVLGLKLEATGRSALKKNQDGSEKGCEATLSVSGTFSVRTEGETPIVPTTP